MDTTGIHREIHTRLAAVRKKQNVAGILHGAALSGFVFLLALLLALLAEETFRFSIAGRTVLFWSLVILAVPLFLLRIGRPLARLTGILPGSTDLETARDVGRLIGRVSDRLANVLELLGSGDAREIYSGELVQAALVDLRADCEGIDFTSTVDGAGSRRMGRFLAAAFLSAVLLFALLPTAFFGAADRLLHFNEAYASAASLPLHCRAGLARARQGRNRSGARKVTGEKLDGITIAFRRRGDLSYEERALRADAAGEFRHQFPSVTETMEYYVHARGVRTDDYTLTVTDRPVIKLLRATVFPPAYSRLPERRQDDNAGDVAALRGSTLRYRHRGEQGARLRAHRIQRQRGPSAAGCGRPRAREHRPS